MEPEGFIIELEPFSNYKTPAAQVKGDAESEDIYFSMTDNPYLQIESQSGKIFYKHHTSRDRKSSPDEVSITVRKIGTSLEHSQSFRVVAKNQGAVESAYFATNATTVSLAENAYPETEIRICDIQKNPNENPFIRIMSGNEEKAFTFDAERLRLSLFKSLGNSRAKSFHIILKLGSDTLFSLCQVNINVVQSEMERDIFAITNFVTSVAENTPLGTTISSPPTSDLNGVKFWTDSFEFPVMNEKTPQIITRINLDYELKTSYAFSLYANDSAGRLSSCNMKVLVESQDEYAPVMEQSKYYFGFEWLGKHW